MNTSQIDTNLSQMNLLGTKRRRMHTSELAHKLSCVDDFIKFFKDCCKYEDNRFHFPVSATVRAAEENTNEGFP